VRKRTVPSALLVPAAIGLLAAAAARSPRPSADALASEILRDTGVQGGLVVHLGCGDGRLTAALHQNDRYLVHGLDSDPEKVSQARAHILSRRLYGPVSVEHWDQSHLPYTDNLVNLLVAEQLADVPMREVRRVLAPKGVAYIAKGDGWEKITKPWPDDIDEWTHDVHGPDGNPVAQDRVVGPPKHYQWTAGPTWLRSHDSDASVSAVVTAQGRLFYIIDGAPISLPGNHPLPDKWSLMARDAFNGVFLWQVPIEKWGWREWRNHWFAARPDNLPVSLARRLVAVGDRVYVTLGYHAPVSQLDAATGHVLRTYDGTADTREILCCDGTLILSVYSEGRLRLVAVEADTGETLWRSEEDYAGSAREYFTEWQLPGEEKPPPVDPALNPAADGRFLCFLDGQEVVGLDFSTGRELWRTKVEEKEPAAWVGCVILHDGVVLHAKPEELLALSAETGERLWSQPKRAIGWLWFQWKDVFAIDDLVWTWSAELGTVETKQGDRTVKNHWPLSINGYDVHTGEVKRQVSLGNIFTAPHHHRCYRNKATSRYVLASRRGTEFVDLESGKHTVHNWVRGACHLGMMPANGLQYAPPHPCVCYINEKINGFVALAPESPPRSRSERKTGPRLERGPAYGSVEGPPSSADDWPTYRHDPLRSGATDTALPSRLGVGWRSKLGGKLSPPTVVGARVFLSLVDEHQVLAVDASNGDRLWGFTAGARVDGPPTYHEGTLLFGSADGWVYCLRASDGELVWRFRAAPEDRLIGAFGQLESAWPVHGSVLVQNGLAYVAAGRSSHLDGGLFLYALDAARGELVHETHIEGPQMDPDTFKDNLNPEQGALTDVMQGDGQGVYMRHLGFDPELNPAEVAGVTRIRNLGGFLDDSYFKRAFWSLGRPETWGRLVVHDDQSAYLVRMFDTLKMLDPTNFFTPGAQGYTVAARPRHEYSQVSVANSDSLNPMGKPLTVEAWVKAEQPDGVVLARGGSASGYALWLKEGKPRFGIRVNDEVSAVGADERVVGRWVHLVGQLTRDKRLRVYIDGSPAASADAPSLILAPPGQATQVGADVSTGVGDYESPFPLTGVIDEVRVYHRELSEAEIREHHARPGEAPRDDEHLVLCFSFDRGDAADESGKGNDGLPQAVRVVDGKSGKAFEFSGGSGAAWSLRIPVRVRAMVAASALGNGGERTADRLLVVAGPPDVVDPKDPLGAFDGRKGAEMWVFSADSGKVVAKYLLDAPPVFDGMAAAQGSLYLSTTDGQLLCLARE